MYLCIIHHFFSVKQKTTENNTDTLYKAVKKKCEFEKWVIQELGGLSGVISKMQSKALRSELTLGQECDKHAE